MIVHFMEGKRAPQGWRVGVAILCLGAFFLPVFVVMCVRAKPVAG